MADGTAPGSPPLDRGAKIALAVVAVVAAALLGFIFTLGPTGTRVACRRASGECVILESYGFGLLRERRLVHAQADVVEARLKATVQPAMGRARPPAVLELVFKDGTSYPAIDYLVIPWTRAKIDRFNRYLKDPADPEIELDSLAPSLAVLAVPAAAALFLGGLLAWKKRRV